jgi:hypothetical protein
MGKSYLEYLLTTRFNFRKQKFERGGRTADANNGLLRKTDKRMVSTNIQRISG